MITNKNYLIPESPEEQQAFLQLQSRLEPLFRQMLSDPLALRTILVIPSLSMDQQELSKISGVHHYEERMLCMLMLLRFPRARLIYVTSQPVDPAIIDYYLHLLPGIPSAHARRRLTLLSCRDASLVPLTQKILQRPRLLERIRTAMAEPEVAHMTCFVAGPLEKTLAVRLGIPLYACDPALSDLGSKSGSREIFREAGVLLPDGFERLRDEKDVIQALAALKSRNPELSRAVIKLNEGFSGEGNGVFSFQGWPPQSDLQQWIGKVLPARLKFEAATETWEAYREKFAAMGGIVESFVEAEETRSPSVQCRIDPLGTIELISTHEQVLGGPSGQVFLGCAFPARSDYRVAIQQAGQRIAEVLRERKVLGRFGIDFIMLRQGDSWQPYAIEINLRKGGTTHTYMMLEYLTDGRLDPDSGLYQTPTGQARYYYATDNLQAADYCGLTPDDLIDIAVENGLHFHGANQQGVVFHLIGALSEFGKLGMVSIASDRAKAQALYENTIKVIDHAVHSDHAKLSALPVLEDPQNI
jgi:hypothetical protein